MTAPSSRLITPVLVGGCLVLFVSFGIRAAFGLFQIPVAEDFGWPRAEFSLAIAIQNLFWGIGQPLFAALADRWGPRRAIALGAATYAAGLLAAAEATTPGGHQMLNMVIGMGISGTGFGVILAMVGKAASDEHRSLALGIATAAGSAGQFLVTPIAGMLLAAMPWPQVFQVFAVMILVTLLALPLLRGTAPDRTAGGADSAPMGPALRRAVTDPSYLLIFLGFFSCGYQLGFITAHFPAFITEACAAVDPSGVLAGFGISSTSQLGAWAIAVIGAMNIAGTLIAGRLGAVHSKRLMLALIYTGRTVASAAFILLPMTPLTVLVFSAVMGSLWLATVPLTAGLVGQIYGMRYMGTLYGGVFLSHQLGGFLGVWLGGALYDRFGSYDAVWWVGVGIGAFSAIVHLPINERPLDARGAVPA